MIERSGQATAVANPPASDAFNDRGIGHSANPQGRMVSLLLRYPHVSDSETEEMAGFIRSARRRDIGAILTTEFLRSRLERFTRDHRRRLAAPASEVRWMAVAIILMLAICGWLWDQRLQPLANSAPTVSLSAS